MLAPLLIAIAFVGVFVATFRNPTQPRWGSSLRGVKKVDESEFFAPNRQVIEHHIINI
jgi:hypothetical protein